MHDFQLIVTIKLLWGNQWSFSWIERKSVSELVVFSKCLEIKGAWNGGQLKKIMSVICDLVVVWLLFGLLQENYFGKTQLMSEVSDRCYIDWYPTYS